MDAVVADVTMDSGMRSLALLYAVAVFFAAFPMDVLTVDALATRHALRGLRAK